MHMINQKNKSKIKFLFNENRTLKFHFLFYLLQNRI